MLQYMELNEVDFLERLAAAFEEVKKEFSGSWSTTWVTIQKLRNSGRMPHLIRQDNIVLRL